jgi:hypothetical protein
MTQHNTAQHNTRPDMMKKWVQSKKSNECKEDKKNKADKTPTKTAKKNKTAKTNLFFVTILLD